ncbi:hypothetical protein RLIN73S_06013 [Rhodanobacter lindaniclasticus]
MQRLLRSLVPAALALLLAPATGHAASPAPAPHLLSTLPLGGAGGWDYLSFDAPHRHLFVSRGDRVLVIDVDPQPADCHAGRHPRRARHRDRRRPGARLHQQWRERLGHRVRSAHVQAAGDHRRHRPASRCHRLRRTLASRADVQWPRSLGQRDRPRERRGGRHHRAARQAGVRRIRRRRPRLQQHRGHIRAGRDRHRQQQAAAHVVTGAVRVAQRAGHRHAPSPAVLGLRQPADGRHRCTPRAPGCPWPAHGRRSGCGGVRRRRFDDLQRQRRKRHDLFAVHQDDADHYRVSATIPTGSVPARWHWTRSCTGSTSPPRVSAPPSSRMAGTPSSLQLRHPDGGDSRDVGDILPMAATAGRARRGHHA